MIDNKPGHISQFDIAGPEDQQRLNRVFAYATERFIDQIENLLDDPHGMIGDDSRKEFFDTIRQRARDLELNLELMIDQLGTGFEAERLRKMMEVRA